MTGKLQGERLFSTPTRADNRRNIPPTLPSGTLGMFRDHGNTGAVPDSLRTDTAVPLCRATNPLGCVLSGSTIPGRNQSFSRAHGRPLQRIAGASWSRLVPGLGVFTEGLRGDLQTGMRVPGQNGPVAVSWPATTCVPADGLG